MIKKFGGKCEDKEDGGEKDDDEYGCDDNQEDEEEDEQSNDEPGDEEDMGNVFGGGALENGVSLDFHTSPVPYLMNTDGGG